LKLKNFLMDNSITLLSKPTFDPFQNSKSLVAWILSWNLNFTSLLNWKNFLKESLIMFWLLNSLTFNPLWSSRSLASQILSWNLNFTLGLKKHFVGEIDDVSYFFEKKIKIHTLTQNYLLPKPPHCKNGSLDLCLMSPPPSMICNEKCLKWSLHFIGNDGWDGTRLDANYAMWQCCCLIFYLGLLLNVYGIILLLV